MALELVNLTTYPKLLKFYRIAELFTGMDHDFLRQPWKDSLTYTYPSTNDQGNWVSRQIEVDRRFAWGLWLTRENMYRELQAEGHQATANDFLADISKRYTLK